MLVGGPEALRDAVAPVFDAIGVEDRLGGGAAGRRAQAQAGRELVGAACYGGHRAGRRARRGLGLDPQLFLDTIAGGPLDTPYAQLKGKAMIAEEFPTSFAWAVS